MEFNKIVNVLAFERVGTVLTCVTRGKRCRAELRYTSEAAGVVDGQKNRPCASEVAVDLGTEAPGEAHIRAVAGSRSHHGCVEIDWDLRWPRRYVNLWKPLPRLLRIQSSPTRLPSCG